MMRCRCIWCGLFLQSKEQSSPKEVRFRKFVLLSQKKRKALDLRRGRSLEPHAIPSDLGEVSRAD
jgi:hypothetical protein